MRRSLPFLIVTSLLLAACGEPTRTIPTGVQTIVGTLQRAELKADRRGTHVLLQNNVPVLYVESRTGSLLESEGYDVTIMGLVEQNRDPSDMPVIVVQKIQKILQTLRTWSIPRLAMNISTPETWTMVDRDERATGGKFYTDFRAANPDGTSGVVLSLWTQTGTTLPAGSLTTIAGKTAIRSQNGTGLLFAVVHGPSLLMFGFASPPPHLEQILSSIAFTDAPKTSSSSKPVTSASSVPGQPCGGVAGIICPAGQYCAITDRASNSGICK